MKPKKYLLLAVPVLSLMFGGIAIVQAAAPKSPAAGSSLEQRVVQRKKEQNVKLSEGDRERLTQRCRSVQSKLLSTQQSLTGTINGRRNQYGKIDAKIWIAIGQLKLAGRDTFQLEKLLNDYEKQVSTFNKIAGEYTQSIDDSAVVNCEADIVAFTALLGTARAYHEQIRSHTDAISTHVVDKIKPELTKLGQNL